MTDYLADYLRRQGVPSTEPLTARGAALAREYGRYQGDLTAIAGVGDAAAHQFILAGIHNIADLRRANAEGRVKLTTMQLIGMAYHEDLIQPIPREEIHEIGVIMRGIMNTIAPTTVEIVGSYRRGAARSSDIDLLVSCERPQIDIIGRLIDALGPSTPVLAQGRVRGSFLYKHRGVVRQVDVLAVPKSSWAAALLYFTGSWEFNIKMRQIAKKKGYRLSQNGLFRGDTKIRTVSESAIFERLDIPYVEPNARDL